MFTKVCGKILCESTHGPKLNLPKLIVNENKIDTIFHIHVHEQLDCLEVHVWLVRDVELQNTATVLLLSSFIGFLAHSRVSPTAAAQTTCTSDTVDSL